MTTIRPATKRDSDGIVDVCWHTGFMGEDLAGMGRFNDKRLFGYLFCLYYALYETSNCFVADDDGRVVGYIIGTSDAAGYQARFDRRMMPRIVARLFLYTSWRHPESFRELLFWARHSRDAAPPPPGYPACLHINLLADHQRLGLGGGLIRAYEKHLRESGIGAVFLETSNHNTKALPFYEKNGYSIIARRIQSHWKGDAGHEALIFGKTL